VKLLSFTSLVAAIVFWGVNAPELIAQAVLATPTQDNQPVIRGLIAKGPAAELRDQRQLFGQFVGDWEIESRWFLDGGQQPTGKGEVHFGWILSGTAVQDVWCGHIKNPPPGYPEFAFGTTIRFYDPAIKAWRCVWIAPQESTLQLFIARAVGKEIVLEGKTPEGYPLRWIYSDITADSFRWHSEELQDVGKTWRTTQIILARRVITSR
jgi:hypothetical protein